MKFDCNQLWLLSLPFISRFRQGIVWRWYIAVQLHFPEDDFYASLLKTTHVSMPTQLQRLLDYLQKIRAFHLLHAIFPWWHAYSNRTYTKYGEIWYRNVFWLRNDGNGFDSFSKKIRQKTRRRGKPLLGRKVLFSK